MPEPPLQLAQDSSASFPPEWYYRQIETLAPQKPDYPYYREDLYRILRTGGEPRWVDGELREMPPVPRETEILILATIWTALYSGFEREKALAVGIPWYVQERQRLLTGPLANGWEEIPNHPLVWEVQWHPPNRGQVVFYPLPKVRCPHDRYTKECITIREKVEQIKRIQQIPKAGAEPSKDTDADELRTFSRALIRGRLPKLVRELKEKSIDPDRAQPEDFCKYREPTDRDVEEDWAWMDAVDPRTPQPSPHGPPRNYFLNAFVANIVGDLIRTGWLISASIDFLKDVLTFCFDIQQTPQALRRRWNRLSQSRRAFEAMLPPHLKTDMDLS
jgi:hypothetical protein